MKDRHFEKLRERIVDELYRARSHLNILRDLHEPPNELREIRTRYITFFFLTTYAHSDRFCISIYNLAKKDKETGNIPRLLNYIQSNKELSKRYENGEIQEMRRRICAHKETINRIVELRTKGIAHNELPSVQFPYLDYYKQDGEELVSELCSIINEISAKYDGETYSDISWEPIGTTTQLLSDLTVFKSKRMAELGETNHD